MVDSASYDGVSAAELERTLGLPRLVLRDRVTSTMDLAHELAQADAPAGTLVLAEEQSAGRGRQGKSWASARGAGIWMTLVERPTDPRSAEVLSLRVGLAAEGALRRFTPERVALKWPNDLYTAAGKLAGILIEARWVGQALDYVLIGFGVNLRHPDVAHLTDALAPTSRRTDVLAELVPALRRAAAQSGHLSEREMLAFRRLAMGLGGRCTEPAPGTFRGVSPAGELLVEDDRGALTRHRTGSLVFEGVP